MKKHLSIFLAPPAALAALFLCAMALERTAGAAGTLSNSAAVNRTVTPNHDNKNDTFIFRCYNPKDYRINASIYGLRGEKVASMRTIPPNPDPWPYRYLEWDPDSGYKAPGGVYVYEVIVNDKSYKGAVVVVR